MRTGFPKSWACFKSQKERLEPIEDVDGVLTQGMFQIPEGTFGTGMKLVNLTPHESFKSQKERLEPPMPARGGRGWYSFKSQKERLERPVEGLPGPEDGGFKSQKERLERPYLASWIGFRSEFQIPEGTFGTGVR